MNEEACNTVNATLHVINQVLTPIDSTIAEYLDDSRFSMFTALLGTAMILDFLDNPQVSRTVFVVEDEVIASTFPSELMSCIVNYMRRPLNDILLYHIGQGAYYSPSLEISSFFYTVLGEFLKVDTDEETGQILLGECEVPIIEPDIISASNGVIHVIDRVLFPDQFDFGMCSEFVPVPSPAECPVEPAPSPSPSPPLPSHDHDSTQLSPHGNYKPHDRLNTYCLPACRTFYQIFIGKSFIIIRTWSTQENNFVFEQMMHVLYAQRNIKTELYRG